MTTNRIALLISAVAILLSLASQRVEAAGNEFTSTFSGTFVTTAFDLDGDSCMGTPPVCTDLSFLDTIAGKTAGGIGGGQFTGQSLVELVVFRELAASLRLPQSRAARSAPRRTPANFRALALGVKQTATAARVTFSPVPSLPAARPCVSIF
jgi:hypothetical protein